MANRNLQRTSFAHGELSPRMLGRTDLDTYRQGCKTMANWLPAKSGAAVMRGGTESLAQVADGFDWLIPLRGGAEPLLGLYNPTTQTFRVMKGDGFYVGTEAAPIEVVLYETNTATVATTVEPYVIIAVGDSGEDFYDAINLLDPHPNANAFKVKLTLGAGSQTFKVDEISFDTDGIISMTIERKDENLINAHFAGNNVRYLDTVVLSSSGNVTLQIAPTDNMATAGSVAGDARLIPWENSGGAGGTVTISYADDPGELPLYAIEPNLEYDTVKLSLFRNDADVKVYEITSSSITLDDKSPGEIPAGRVASHGAYFEQRFIVGGGADHRQEIYGSRMPDEKTGDTRFNVWDQSTTKTTEVEGTSLQGFRMANAVYGKEVTGRTIELSPKDTAAARLISDAFCDEANYGARFFATLSLHEAKAGISGDGRTGNFRLTIGADEAGAGAGSHNLSNAFRDGARVKIKRGSAEVTINFAPGAAQHFGTPAQTNEPYLFRPVNYDGSETSQGVAQFVRDIYKVGRTGGSQTPRAPGNGFYVTFELGTVETTSSEEQFATHACHWVIDTGTLYSEIRWMVQNQGILILGTSTGISAAQFLDPTDTPEIRVYSGQAVARRPPAVGTVGVVAISADRTAIYETTSRTDLTAYAEDRFSDDKVRQIALQQQPVQRLWAVTDAGKIHVLTMQDETFVNGWTTISHNHSGTALGVVVTPGVDGDDGVWILMKHGTQNYLELYHEATTGSHANRVFMDSAVKLKVGKQTFVPEQSDYAADSMELIAGRTDAFQFGALFSGQGLDKFFGKIGLVKSTGAVTLHITGDHTEGVTNANDDLDGGFETAGTVTITHTDPIVGTVSTIAIPFTSDTSDPYSFTPANHAAVTTFVTAMLAIYPVGGGPGVVPGAENYSIEFAVNTPELPLPEHMISATGTTDLVITSADPAGDTSLATPYENRTAAANNTAVDTNFSYGDEVWVGYPITADIVLPPIDQSISDRASGSWIGQPARVAWQTVGVEKANSLQVGPTFDKLVEYFADAPTTFAASGRSTEVTLTMSGQTSEPYTFTPSESAAIANWVTDVKALSPAPEGYNFTVTFTTADGATAQSFVTQAIDLITGGSPYFKAQSVVGRTENLIGSAFLISAAAEHVRSFASLQLNDSGSVVINIDVAAVEADKRLNTSFEAGGKVTIRYDAERALDTGHERRAMPVHITTTEPTVVRKNAPSPCTLTFLVAEATSG